jgi:hypothetical protein
MRERDKKKYLSFLGKVVYGKTNWNYIFGIDDTIGTKYTLDPVIYLNTFSSKYMGDFVAVYTIKTLPGRLKPPTEKVCQTVIRIVFRYQRR